VDAKRNAVAARSITRRVPWRSTLPPVMRLSGHRPTLDVFLFRLVCGNRRRRRGSRSRIERISGSHANLGLQRSQLHNVCRVSRRTNLGEIGQRKHPVPGLDPVVRFIWAIGVAVETEQRNKHSVAA
jgi:hypothetical protein